MDKFNENYKRSLVNCWQKFIIFIIAIRSFIVRCIFILYASIAIWNVVIVKGSMYWLLLVTLAPLFIETFNGIQKIKLDTKPKSKLSKWFAPVFFLFLVCACPPIWIMELTIASNHSFQSAKLNISTLKTTAVTRYETKTTRFEISSTAYITYTQKPSTATVDNLKNETISTLETESPLSYSNDTNMTSPDLYSSNSSSYNSSENLQNSTEGTTVENILISITPSNNSTYPKITTSPADFSIYPNVTMYSTNSSMDPNIIYIKDNLTGVFEVFSDFKNAIETTGADVLRKIENIFSYLALPNRTTILEQILLLTLIICRWLLPRGNISRNQLSQLLLVNIGMAADILELLEALKENVVRHNLLLNIIILLMWQASLFQFSLTKTVTKARKIRVGFFEDYSSKSNTETKLTLTNCICCQTELWAIATSLLLQDIPFFCLRITLIVDFDVLSYSNLFFTCKNALVILLQLFRSYVIVSGKNESSQLEGTVSKQSLAIGSVARWNQIQGSYGYLGPTVENRNPIFTDKYENTITRQENGSLFENLPRASPELSISSKENIKITNSYNSIPSLENNKNIL